MAGFDSCTDATAAAVTFKAGWIFVLVVSPIQHRPGARKSSR